MFFCPSFFLILISIIPAASQAKTSRCGRETIFPCKSPCSAVSLSYFFTHLKEGHHARLYLVSMAYLFYLYCFFGWIFESSYVSILKRRFVNRGFLRIPMLPLYGSGAVMMLVVSEPFQDSLLLTWVSGVIGATILEYVTGWAMEQLFKVRYWDYSNQKFNLHGYICLSSSIAWGFLTIFMTHVIHKPIERAVLFPCPSCGIFFL